jgi:hypothetical protein
VYITPDLTKLDNTTFRWFETRMKRILQKGLARQ